MVKFERMSVVLYIKHSKLGKGLTDEELKKISEIILQKKFKKGEIIFKEKDKSDSLIIIKKGRVVLKAETSNGTVEFGVMREGDYFGELSLAGTSSRLITAEALEDCETFFLPVEQFKEFAKNNPFTACKILSNLLSIFSEKLQELSKAFLQEIEF